MKSDETTVFLNFISFDVCSFSCRKQLDFFGWRFLFEIAFGRDFFGWTFWVEVPPQILFGTFFPNWLVKISFQIFG